jgi:Hint domain-containing protein
LSQAQWKYALLARFGPISWCDPDYYPVAHADEQVLAEQRLPEIQADTETYAAILDHLGIAGGADLSEAQKLAIYREWKLLNAVHLTPTGDGRFGFDLITETDVGLGRGVHSVGTIDAQGTIEVQLTEDSFLTACPICLSRGTLIDTPRGPVPVELLRQGDVVWTVDAFGRRVATPLLQVGSTPVPSTHRVVHLVLDDARELWVSPGHPLADGRTLGELSPGDLMDSARVVTAELVAYAGGSTFDILPGGATGFYWANGVLLASTLR